MTARSLIALLAVAMLVLAVASTPAGPATVGASTGTPMTAVVTTTGVPATAAVTTTTTTGVPATVDAPSPNPTVVIPPLDTDEIAGNKVRLGLNVEGNAADYLPGTAGANKIEEVFDGLDGVAGSRVVSSTTVAGKKFIAQDALVVVDVTLTSAAQAQAFFTALNTAVNSGTFAAAGITVNSITQLPAPGSPAAGGSTTSTTPAAPAGAPSGATTSGNIDITILGTRAAFTTTDQNALTVAVATAISGTAAVVNIVETNTNARKFTMQASALRVTVAVTAPAAQYPTLASIVARLQTVARQNQGRLGNSTVVSITISNSDSAAGRGPVAMTFLVALLVAVLSAMAQF